MPGLDARALRSYLFSALVVAAVGATIAWMIATGGQRSRHLGAMVETLTAPEEPAPGSSDGETMDSVRFLGQTVKLSRGYHDFEEYADDPQRLPPESMRQAEQLIRAAELPQSFDSREAMIGAVAQLEFPGFGMMQMGDARQADGGTLSGHGVELPSLTGRKLRYFVFRAKDGPWRLVDDFVDGERSIVAVRQEGDALVYLDARQEVVLRRALGGQGVTGVDAAP